MKFFQKENRKAVIELEMGAEDILILTTKTALTQAEYQRLKDEMNSAFKRKEGRVVILENMDAYVVRRK